MGMEKGTTKPRRRNPFKLRLPDPVRAQAHKIAEAKGISLNAWICNLVTRAIDEQAGPRPARS